MDLAVSNVNETAEHYHKVEHVPGVAEVVLVGEDRRREERVEKEGRRDRQRKRERGKEERRHVSGGGTRTYVDLGHSDVNEGAEDNDEIKTVPGVTEIILK